MKKDWTLREELYIALHRWPSMIGFFILGCLLGLAGAYLWPASNRATVQIYVGLNPYRAFSDTGFQALANPKYSNVDDYKHWQMSQLETVIFLDGFIQDTLTELRRGDPYWDQVSLDQLRAILFADWRSAGTWSLSAEHPVSQYAVQAANAWSEIILERIPQAILSAQDTFMIDQEHQEMRTRLLDAETHLQLLTVSQQTLQSWLDSAQNEPQDQVLPAQIRWSLISQIASIADFSPAWLMLLEAQPASDASLSEYITWVRQALVQIDTDLAQLPEQIAALESASQELKAQYTLANQASLGLSPNLTIEGLEALPAKQIRPVSTFLLVGGVAGLCFWIVWQLVRIARRDYYP